MKTLPQLACPNRQISELVFFVAFLLRFYFFFVFSHEIEQWQRWQVKLSDEQRVWVRHQRIGYFSVAFFFVGLRARALIIARPCCRSRPAPPRTRPPAPARAPAPARRSQSQPVLGPRSPTALCLSLPDACPRRNKPITHTQRPRVRQTTGFFCGGYFNVQGNGFAPDSIKLDEEWVFLLINWFRILV